MDAFAFFGRPGDNDKAASSSSSSATSATPHNMFWSSLITPNTIASPSPKHQRRKQQQQSFRRHRSVTVVDSDTDFDDNDTVDQSDSSQSESSSSMMVDGEFITTMVAAVDDVTQPYHHESSSSSALSQSSSSTTAAIRTIGNQVQNLDIVAHDHHQLLTMSEPSPAITSHHRNHYNTKDDQQTVNDWRALRARFHRRSFTTDPAASSTSLAPASLNQPEYDIHNDYIDTTQLSHEVCINCKHPLTFSAHGNQLSCQNQSCVYANTFARTVTHPPSAIAAIFYATSTGTGVTTTSVTGGGGRGKSSSTTTSSGNHIETVASDKSSSASAAISTIGGGNGGSAAGGGGSGSGSGGSGNLAGGGGTVSYSTTDYDDDNGQIVSSTFHTSFTSNYVAFSGYYAKDGSVSSAGSLTSIFLRPDNDSTISNQITSSLNDFFGPRYMDLIGNGSSNDNTTTTSTFTPSSLITATTKQKSSLTTSNTPTPTLVGGGGSRNMTFKSPHQIQPDICFAQLKRAWVDQNLINYLAVCIAFSTKKQSIDTITIYDVYSAIRAHGWKELYKEMCLQIYCRMVQCPPPHLNAVEKARVETLFDQLYPHILQCHREEVQKKANVIQRINSQYVWYRVYAMTNGASHMLKFIRLGDYEAVTYMKRVCDRAILTWRNGMSPEALQMLQLADADTHRALLAQWAPPIEKPDICPILHVAQCAVHGESAILSDGSTQAPIGSLKMVFDNVTHELSHIVFAGLKLTAAELQAAYILHESSSSIRSTIRQHDSDDDDDSVKPKLSAAAAAAKKRPPAVAKPKYMPVRPLVQQQQQQSNTSKSIHSPAATIKMEYDDNE